jgi:hypothetical protein
MKKFPIHVSVVVYFFPLDLPFMGQRDDQQKRKTNNVQSRGDLPSIRSRAFREPDCASVTAGFLNASGVEVFVLIAAAPAGVKITPA